MGAASLRYGRRYTRCVTQRIYQPSNGGRRRVTFAAAKAADPGVHVCREELDGHAFGWRIKNARLGVQPIERYHLAKNQTADVAPRAPRCSPPECKRIRNDGVQQHADLRAANWILRMKRPARRERQACRLVRLRNRSMCKRSACHKRPSRLVRMSGWLARIASQVGPRYVRSHFTAHAE